MLRFSLIAAWILTFSASLFAQEMTPDHLVALGKYKMKRIDSILMADGYTNKRSNDGPGFTMTMYAFQAKTDSGGVLRNMLVSYRSNMHMLELDYGVWQKSDADRFIAKLLQAGYKRTVSTMKGLSPGDTMKMVSYKKGPVAISYDEHDRGTGILEYAFSLTVENYRP